MEIQALRDFLGIAAHRTLRETALALGRSQASLSGSLLALETELGVRLVDRSREHFSLTAAGVKLRELAAAQLAQLAEDDQNVGLAARRVAGASSTPARGRRLFYAEPTRRPTPLPGTPRPSPVPGIGAMPAPFQPDPEDGSAQSASDLFQELQRFLADARASMAQTDDFPWAGMVDVLDRALASLRRSAELVWVAFRPPDAGGDHLASHHARVAILAMRIGESLGREHRQLVDLGMAGCLIDVGLWQAPDTIGGTDALRPQPRGFDRTHPERSAGLVRTWSPPSEAVIETVLHHHERERGGGYPYGLEGSAIALDAKIIGLVDTYARLTVPPASRSRVPPDQAVREILRTRQEMFSPLVMKAFLAETSMFPPGTLVRLNSGEVGRVTGVNPSQPLRPRLEIVAAAKGQPMRRSTTIDLAQTPSLYVTAVAES